MNGPHHAQTLDWFSASIDGKESFNVTSGLNQVFLQEEHRLHFARALKTALANPIPHAPDRIQLIHDDIRALDKTLRLRLTMLPLDRPQAWFRTSPPGDKSPIASMSFHDPIFLAFEEAKAQLIRKCIPELWQAKISANEVYDPGFSLWGRILKLNVRLAALNQLGAPFQDVTLEDMPDAIPDEFLTPCLSRLGHHLAQRMKACQRELEGVYQYFWSRSESFLAALHIQHLASEKRRSSKDFVPRLAQDALEDALRFMNFARLPSFEELRLRYRSMAHSLHPDRGGNEERFKLLSVHYQSLLKQLQRL